MRVGQIYLLVFTFLSGGPLVTEALADSDWMQRAQYSCSDPLNVQATSKSQGWFPENNLMRTAELVSGHKVVYFSAKLVHDGVIPINKPFLIAKNQLSDTNINTLSELIKAHADMTRIPWYISMLTPDPAEYVEQQVLSFGLKTYIEWLKEQLNVNSVTLDQLSLFVAKGGYIARSGTFAKSATQIGRNIFIDTLYYNVSLGNEQRSAVLASCTYPAEPQITIITVKYPNNTSHVYAAEGNKWLSTGMTANGQVVSRNTLIKIDEDDTYMYFQLACTKVEFCIRYKVGKWNGINDTKFEISDSADGPHFYPDGWDESDDVAGAVSVSE